MVYFKNKYPKFFITMLLVISTSRIIAQWVTIPDPNFVNFLNSNGFSSCMNGNLMDTTCSLVTNSTQLNCNSSNIFDLSGIQYFDSLQILSCQGNQLVSLPTLPADLINLNCNNNQLVFLPDLPVKLGYLECEHNQLINLPNLPNSLLNLTCHYNQLSFLPTLSLNLQYLECSFNQISNLPILPNGLTDLGCDDNLITNLPTLPGSLTSLTCSFNQISALPVLPNSLVYLYCQGNNLTSLPALPPFLKGLYCGFNQIVSMPGLPNYLDEFECENNQISSLPPLPSYLTFLYCANNQLQSLPSLDGWLGQLFCYNNPLLILPPLPQSLLVLNCGNTLLTSIPELPDYMTHFYANDIPTLLCLPRLKTIKNLSFTNTGIQCLPNYGSVINSSPILSFIPLCDLFNSNGCTAYWNISGKTYNDTNNNCLAEPTEFRIANIKINLFHDTVLQQQTFSGGEGLFSFDTDTGSFNFTVDTNDLPVLVTCPVGGQQTSTLTPSDSMDYDMDFGLQCKPGFDIGIRSIYAWNFNPGSNTIVKFLAGDISNFYGLHCASGVSGTFVIVFSGPVSYIGPGAGSLTPVLSGDSLIYMIPDFGNINFNSDFVVQMHTDSTALLGNQVCFFCAITPQTGDIYPDNNSLIYCYNIVNSFDPNSKMVNPSGIINTLQEWLSYTINFQNTGTFAAQNIFIIDTIDANLDASSFELLSFSNQPITQINGGVIRFNFPSINLPDSNSNEPGSHGYVQYRLKLIKPLANGTKIENTANIYFDLNSPVTTNTVSNVFIDCNAIQLATVSFNHLSFCKGDSLDANVSTLNNAQTTWFLDSVLIGNGSTISIDTLGSGYHVITLMAKDSICTQFTSYSVFVDEPVKPTFNINGNLLTSSSLSDNQWLLNSNNILGATQNNYIVLISGWYMVSVTDSMGCVAYSDSTFISVAGNAEIDQNNFFLAVNPTNGNIKVTYFIAQNKSSVFEIFDIMGKKVYSMALPPWSSLQYISLPKLADGIYNAVITSEGYRKSQKLVMIKVR